jgi:hypothetical protein
MANDGGGALHPAKRIPQHFLNKSASPIKKTPIKKPPFGGFFIDIRLLNIKPSL